MSKINKYFIKSFILFSIGSNFVFSQVETNKIFLENFSNRKQILSDSINSKIDDYVLKKNISREYIYPDGSIGVLEDVINNEPVYNKPLGMPSIKGMRVDSLWSNGGMIYDLTGNGYDKIGLWESYHPYDHPEYNGRINIGDGGRSDYNFSHSTSTAGIIIASGLNSNAIGIAQNANLKIFSTVNRLAEMALEASRGMELASYSYQSHKYYGGTEADIDTISYAGSNFLLFQACGNDGSETPNMVMGQQKNSITIGAVKINNPPHFSLNEIIRSNSSMGPTIDGRIKPDIVAPFYGDDICNQKEISGYTLSVNPTTSWSTASAAGVSVLLQQFYQQLHNGDALKSSTLKALLLHTAFEAGHLGPDYEFGWGMINAKSAVNNIYIDSFYNEVIEEIILLNGNIYQKQIYSDGSKPIKVTICWNDPPSESSTSSDSTIKLINDLDLRVKIDGQIFYPWILDPINPFNSAETGDNILDNVEQIYIENPQEGNYTIEVSHKENLSNDGILTNSTQMFSIITYGENYCSNGSIILNNETNRFNFCKDGYWVEKF